MNKKLLKVIRKINNLCLDFSAKYQLAHVIGRPNGLMVEPFSGCNYNCPLCPSGNGVLNRAKSKMTFEEFQSFIGSFVYTTEYITLFHFGEPLLHNELHQFVKYCTENHIVSQISTNGMLLTEEKARKLFAAGLDRLIFSIDTYDGDLYTRYRVNGDFDEVVSNIHMALKIKQEMQANTVIVAQYMLMNDNEDVARMRRHGKELGVDEVSIKTIGIGTSVKDYDSAARFLPQNEQYSRYKKNTVESKFKEHRCTYIYKRMVLCSDGSCLPCCRDQESTYNLGFCDKKTSLKHIWNNAAYVAFRKKALTDISSFAMCDRCPELIKYKLDPWIDKKERINCEQFKL